MTFRWQFRDTETDETFTVPINPNKMTDPEALAKNIQFGTSVRNPGVETPPPLVEWQFEGVIYTQAHHDALEYWAMKEVEVEITDHMSRTWVVMFKSFEPAERRPTPLKPWRFTYAMRALLLERLA